MRQVPSAQTDARGMVDRQTLSFHPKTLARVHRKNVISSQIVSPGEAKNYLPFHVYLAGAGTCRPRTQSVCKQVSKGRCTFGQNSFSSALKSVVVKVTIFVRLSTSACLVHFQESICPTLQSIRSVACLRLQETIFQPGWKRSSPRTSVLKVQYLQGLQRAVPSGQETAYGMVLPPTFHPMPTTTRP